MIEAFTFDSETGQGVRLLVFGAVHGNEKAGTIAIQSWIDKFKNGEVVLASGSVTFVPIANPRAYEADVRFVENNLNRVYLQKDNPDTYEEKLAQDLMELIDEHDALLDLHQVSSPTEAFAFQDDSTPATVEFAQNLGVKNIIVGWNDVFPSGAFCSGCAYSLKQGKPAVVVECGSRADMQASVVVAERAIHNALVHFELLNAEPEIPENPMHFTLVGYGNRAEGEELARHWRGFDVIKKDEEIIVGKTKATEDVRILMPDPGAPIGEEWYYLLKNVH